LQNNQPITLTTARNESFILAIQIDDGINGYWASPGGLSLNLNVDGEDMSFVVVPPRPQGWNGAVVTTSSSDGVSYKVSGTVTLPASIGGPEQRLLTGTLTGKIVYAQGPGYITDQSIDVNVPVTLQLVSQSSYLWSSGTILYEIFVWLDILSAVILLLLAAIPLVRAIKMRSQFLGTTTRSQLKLPKTSTLVLLSAFLVPLSLLFFSVPLWVLFTIVTTSGYLVTPASITTTNMVIPALMGIAFALNVIALIRVP